MLSEIAQLSSEKATNRMQEIYQEPIKPELISQRIKEINESYDVFNKYLPVYKVKLNKKVEFGSPNIANASSILSSIKKTVQFALKKKKSQVL